MEARFNLKVDAMVLPGKTELNGETFQAGDFLCSDGKRSWPMRFEHAEKHLRPCTAAGKRIWEEAVALRGGRPPVTQVGLEDLRP